MKIMADGWIEDTGVHRINCHKLVMLNKGPYFNLPIKTGE